MSPTTKEPSMGSADRSRKMYSRGILRAVLLIGALLAASLLAVGSAQAGPYRQGCNAWAHSTSGITSGISAVCSGNPRSVQYRVVGLCKSRFTPSSRWVEGWWMKDGVSHYGCSRTEIALPNPFYQTR